MAREVSQFLLDQFSDLLKEAEDLIRVPLISHFKSIDKTIKSKCNGNWKSVKQSVAISINRDLRYVVDALSECILQARQRDAAFKKGLLVRYSSYALSGISRVLFSGRMKSRLSQIEEEFKGFNTSIFEESSEHLNWFPLDQRTPPFLHTSEIIGFNETAEAIERALTVENKLRTIGIVGMGGSGKTALAQMVFDKMRPKFEISMWVCLSDTLKDQVDLRADVVKYMLHSVGFEVEQLPFEYEIYELLKILKTRLEGKRYLLVLEDAWNVDEWYADLGNELPHDGRIADKLSDGLPKGSGSVIIVTSRIEHVTRMMVGGNIIFNINSINNQLSKEDIWSIFYQTFKLNGGLMETEVGKELEKMKDDIIEYCDGLPLVARALAETFSSRILVS